MAGVGALAREGAVPGARDGVAAIRAAVAGDGARPALAVERGLLAAARAAAVNGAAGGGALHLDGHGDGALARAVAGAAHVAARRDRAIDPRRRRRCRSRPRRTRRLQGRRPWRGTRSARRRRTRTRRSRRTRRPPEDTRRGTASSRSSSSWRSSWRLPWRRRRSSRRPSSWRFPRSHRCRRWSCSRWSCRRRSRCCSWCHRRRARGGCTPRRGGPRPRGCPGGDARRASWARAARGERDDRQAASTTRRAIHAAIVHRRSVAPQPLARRTRGRGGPARHAVRRARNFLFTKERTSLRWASASSSWRKTASITRVGLTT